MSKLASGTTIFIQEELSDARLLLNEIKHYADQAYDLIDSSTKKDHIHAVAGDILNGLPNALMKLDKALGAMAMAVNKVDYEELKQDLLPEKVENLERVLEEVRLKIPARGDVDVVKPEALDE